MEISLNLSRYCIETASKKKQDRLVTGYFKEKRAEKRKLIEDQISALNYFLKNADFSDLRHRCSRLDSENDIRLIIPPQYRDMHICLNGTILYPKWKD